LSFIQYIATNDASKLEVNQCQYSVLCNEIGGTVDDILVYRLQDEYLIVCNACNYEKVLAWFNSQVKAFAQVEIAPFANHCMLSIQGPKSIDVVSKVLGVDLKNLKHNHLLAHENIYISRTGYTGEDGYELIVSKDQAVKIWDQFIGAKVQPCGLGCRDTLRLEAGLPLYGHEYDDETSPLDAGYPWAVKFDKGNFIGREALLKGATKKLAGIVPQGRAIARQGDKIVDKDSRTSSVGMITSGTFSPTLQRPIAMAYLPIDFNETDVFVSVRNNLIPAKVVAKTFYKR
jgi:aminomethyltransferase